MLHMSTDNIGISSAIWVSPAMTRSATEGGIMPIMLGKYAGVIFACLVQGAAPLLLSKTFVVELKASLRAFQSELDLPEQNLGLQLARARGEHFLLQLDNFARPWSKPPSWALCT